MRLRLLPVLLVLVLTAVVIAMGRKETPDRQGAADTASHAQAISGRVEIWEGNFMPPVDPERVKGQIKPAADRSVRVHAPVRTAGGLAVAKRDSIPTELIAETRTDENGRFFVPVPAGTYSVFAEEDGGWYFNGWSGSGVQGEVTVPAGDTTDVLIKITTKATF